MKSIYDMMGRYTYPILREDAPIEHVEKFFQVGGEGRGGWVASREQLGKGGSLARPKAVHKDSLRRRVPALRSLQSHTWHRGDQRGRSCRMFSDGVGSGDVT